MSWIADEHPLDQRLGLGGVATLRACSRLCQNGLGFDGVAGLLGEAIAAGGHWRGQELITSAGVRPPLRTRAHPVSDLPGPQMLADRNDDLAAAIDDHGYATPLEPRTDGDLDNRDGQQCNEKDDHGSHMNPRQADVPAEITSN